MANNSRKKPRSAKTTKLYADSVELASRLDREIVNLQRVAPPAYENTIKSLKEVMLVIHDAVDRTGAAKRR